MGWNETEGHEEGLVDKNCEEELIGGVGEETHDSDLR